MEPHLSNSPMAPAGANEVSPRPDLPRPQRAFRIRAVVELDPRPPRHTMANVLKATSTTMTRRRRRMTRTCTTPHPGLTSLKRRSPSPTSSSTMTVSSIPTTPTRDRRAQVEASCGGPKASRRRITTPSRRRPSRKRRPSLGGGDQVNNICLEDLWPSSTPSPCTSARSSDGKLWQLEHVA
ncbi:hypothetical protein VPH35_102952 [Triticum aestivum]|uniref:serine/arginine repetitive matrix protein 2 isoform X2 n=1 Tax=Triticum aestivum TaxID=4565 RepID=UPI001D025A89|nr:serine/arginine repetitive matrix protein 2-like isoform X2 [Triticum aestivum]